MVAAELADLRELVARLPKRQRAVVIMRYWQDAQERDIAASLGVTPRAAYERRLRARRPSSAVSRATRCHANDCVVSRSGSFTHRDNATRPAKPAAESSHDAGRDRRRISPIIPRARADAIA